ncbi:hypothetical protein QWY22_01065 [Planococcus liqunii]|uniref:Uncharacterized protein n=1 Tax=Planococcus liqunii TaxID=3058394 RepID=A0ABT8MVJ1_9BACL|nr:MULTISPECIES: hypothetical protein [unclassified Planococcus (in: firmicutes)]MDN7228793.1 hypothetical protein [Planococcus sp. N064]WKA51226.1 hypothetical protein QWY22_01065 [Planococcus sp. N056]
MSTIDKRNRLEEEPFTYRISKNLTVFISYRGKEIKSVKGKEAEKLISRLQQAETPIDLQLVLAKATGHFKHGNEKTGK